MTELIFLVEEDAEGGFTARAIGPSIVTEADSLDELRKAVRESVICHFDRETDRPRMIRLHMVRDEVLSL